MQQLAIVDKEMGVLEKLRGSKRLLLCLNLAFAAAAVIGQVGQNVTLPLWADATNSLLDLNCTNTTKHETNGANSTYQPVMEPYFILSSASFSFVVLFGFITLLILVVQCLLNWVSVEKQYSFLTIKDDLKFPQWQFILIGVFDALNGVLVVFASPSKRTAPFLQAILSNVSIPLVILFRSALNLILISLGNNELEVYF